MRKSKLAIASFILSLMPIVLSLLFLLLTLITAPGTPIQTVTPLEIVDGEVVGGGEVIDTGETVSISDIKVSRLLGTFGFIFFGFLPLTSLSLIISIILGITALIRVRKYNLEGRWLAI